MLSDMSKIERDEFINMIKQLATEDNPVTPQEFGDDMFWKGYNYAFRGLAKSIVRYTQGVEADGYFGPEDDGNLFNVTLGE